TVVCPRANGVHDHRAAQPGRVLAMVIRLRWGETPHTPRPSRSRLPRVRERGATLFVIVLVMTLLMGIGAFAARSAHLATTSSGHVRQQTQARYVGEYGIMIAAARLSGAPGQAFVNAIGTPVDAANLCAGQTATAMTQRTCYKMDTSEVQQK